MLFQGEPEEVRFVTTAPPLALEAAAPFHAVTLGRSAPDRLRVVERLLPADEPFGDGAQVVLSRAVARFRLRYRDETGRWQERWDGKTAAGLPTAIRVELTVREGGRSRSVAGFLVPIVLGKRAT